MTLVNHPFSMGFQTRIATLVALLAAASASGCAANATDAGDAAAADAPVGTASEAFTNGWYWVTWYANTDYNTGLNPAYWTCFLAGVGGEMISGPEWGLPNPAYSGAMISGGTWYQVAQNGFTGTSLQNEGGSDIGTSIMCVPTPAVVGPVHWENWAGNTPAIQLAPVSSTLVCGLTAISSGATGSSIPWLTNAAGGLSTGSSAYVFQNSGYWWLGGSYGAEAWAACINRTPGTAIQSWQFSNGSGTGTSSSFAQLDIGVHQCFLAGVGGSFDGSFDGPDPNDPPQVQGIWLGYDSSNLEWSEHTGDTTSAEVYCIQ
jgi:hypothetical protein